MLASQKHLSTRFRQALAQAGIEGPTAEQILDRVLDAYCLRSRSYHNLEHLQNMLTRLEALRERALARKPDLDELAVVLALFFHDAVYTTDGSVNSEEESARMAQAELVSPKAGSELAREVARLVRTTATHTYQARDVAAAWLCDADLDVFSWPRPRYDDYVARIRREYAQVSDEEWRSGRAAALEKFLARARIYTLASASAEARARSNIRAELLALKP